MQWYQNSKLVLQICLVGILGVRIGYKFVINELRLYLGNASEKQSDKK